MFIVIIWILIVAALDFPAIKMLLELRRLREQSYRWLLDIISVFIRAFIATVTLPLLVFITGIGPKGIRLERDQRIAISLFAWGAVAAMVNYAYWQYKRSKK